MNYPPMKKYSLSVIGTWSFDLWTNESLWEGVSTPTAVGILVYSFITCNKYALMVQETHYYTFSATVQHCSKILHTMYSYMWVYH